MTTGDVEVLGTDDGRRPNRLLPVIAVGVLVAAGSAIALTRGGSHPPAARPTTTPRTATPSIVIVPEAAFGPSRVGRVGSIAVVLSHTPSAPVHGTATTLDGPPGESPLTFTTHGIARAVAGDSTTGWFAERTIAPIDGDGLGTLEARDIRTGEVLAQLALPQVPNSVAVTAGRAWAGLDGSVVEVDTATQTEQVHAQGPGDVIALVPDPSGQHLYGAISYGSHSRIVRWSLPTFAPVGEHALPNGLRPTNLALGPGGLWVSEANATGTTGHIERLDPTTLADASLGDVATDAPHETVYAGVHEMWLLTRSGSLWCVRTSASGVRLGPPTSVPDFTARDDPAGQLVAVGERVYVENAHSTLAYQRSVVCP